MYVCYIFSFNNLFDVSMYLYYSCNVNKIISLYVYVYCSSDNI